MNRWSHDVQNNHETLVNHRSEQSTVQNVLTGADLLVLFDSQRPLASPEVLVAPLLCFQRFLRVHILRLKR